MRIFIVFLVSLFCVSLLTKISLAQADVVDTSARDINSVTEISKSRYVTGGVLGTIFGFGIGHGVQGRWSSDKGWMFTSAQLVAFVGLYFDDSPSNEGVIGCALGDIHHCKSRPDGATYGTISDGLALLYLGTRIWEIASVWNLNEQTHTIAKTKRPLLVAPVAYKDGGGLVMLMSF